MTYGRLKAYLRRQDGHLFGKWFCACHLVPDTQPTVNKNVSQWALFKQPHTGGAYPMMPYAKYQEQRNHIFSEWLCSGQRNIISRQNWELAYAELEWAYKQDKWRRWRLLAAILFGGDG
jgi:hypothetical protein